ncbi:MAG TPA: DNA alkylation repair protein [Micromonosporaceae bacterium]
MTGLADTILARLDETYPSAADPARAAGAARYMRDQFGFLGLTAPQQTRLARTVLAGLAAPTEPDLVAVARGCWQRPEREYQYFACTYLRRHVALASPRLLPTVRDLITTKSWWDTVDTLAAHTVGPLVARYPELVSTMDDWAVDENLWLVRTAILHQLTYGRRTDADRLFRYCLRQAGHRDFFIRKAIGWALRQYARTDPVAVRSFVEEHSSLLAPLSVREAVRHL